MRLTIIRTDKKNQKHFTYKTLGQFAELIAQQQKKEQLEPFRLQVRMSQNEHLRLPIHHELPYVYPVAEMARKANGNPMLRTLNGLVLLTSQRLERVAERRCQCHHLSGASCLRCALSEYVGALESFPDGCAG